MIVPTAHEPFNLTGMRQRPLVDAKDRDYTDYRTTMSSQRRQNITDIPSNKGSRYLKQRAERG